MTYGHIHSSIFHKVILLSINYFYLQEIQKDIEHHSAGVGSVLNLCEVLLHDTDACPSEKEFDALQNAMKSLDKRWKNICRLSPDMRARLVYCRLSPDMRARLVLCGVIYFLWY